MNLVITDAQISKITTVGMSPLTREILASSDNPDLRRMATADPATATATAQELARRYFGVETF